MTFGIFNQLPRWLDGEAIVQRSGDKGTIASQYRSGVVSLTQKPDQKFLGRSGTQNVAFRAKLTRGRVTGPSLAIRLKLTGGGQIRISDIVFEVNLDGGD